MRKQGSTFDIVIRNREHLMALIHFAHSKIHQNSDPEVKVFRSYKWLSLKMKVSWESWLRNKKMAELIKEAIYQTLV